MLFPITAPALTQSPRIAHGFFTRAGGASQGIYEGLNCGPGSGDDPDAVEGNRARVRDYLQADYLVTLWQVHSADCLRITGPLGAGDARPKADALVTDTPGIAIGVLTADCAPILFHGEKDNGDPVIGAAHAGWGGALKGVQVNTVKGMVEAGARLETIIAAIGPCITQSSYEVKEDFLHPFVEQDPASERFFMAGKAGYLQFDLAGYNAALLAGAGVGSVVITGEDTYKDEGRFFSYRRATHRGESDYGRQISAIVIKK